MAARTRGEISGLEFDWLATDEAGLVALFSTAGGGFVPDEFLRDTDAHDDALAIIKVTPRTTSARFAPPVAMGLENTWQLAAERGLFAFDADPAGGPYRLVAAPEQPASLAELPASVAEVARRIRLPVSFHKVTSLSEIDLRREG